MSIVMALEMGLVQAVVRKEGASVTAAELAAMAGQEKLLIGRLPANVDPHLPSNCVIWFCAPGLSLLLGC